VKILDIANSLTYYDVGSVGTHAMPWSEVNMHMGIAGNTMGFEVVGTPGNEMVQLLLPDTGQPFSFPITPGEAGLYRDADGRLYTVEVK
jgi:hypothetical protein